MSVGGDARAAFVADFGAEMALTRAVLERVPTTSLGWTPHVRSFSLGGLATHLAELPHWGARILTGDHYDLTTAAGHRSGRPSTAAILEAFDRHVREVSDVLASRSEADLGTTWTLRRGRVVLLTLTRIDALHRFLLHHAIHHRGQLTVYLRLLDVPLPSLYGPTADEPS